jgi:hypothetical protein
MTRLDPRACVSLALLAATLCYVGCSVSAPAPGPGAVASAPKVDQPKSESKYDKLVSALGKPAAVAVISGQLDGYTEPCGCSDDQEGGLIRRFELVERLRKERWPVALFDLGGLIKDPAGARGGPDQAKIKFDYILKALALLKYDAVALCAEDLKVGVGEALGMFLNCFGQSPKIVAANVQVDPVFAKLFQPSVVAAAGPVKIGVTGVIDPDQLMKLKDSEKDSLIPSIKDPGQVLGGVLADLESKSDFQVLLVQGPPELAKKLGQAHPGFDIVVATSIYDDVLNPEPEPINGDKTLLVTVGHKGKYVGVFGFDPGRSPALTYKLVALDKSLDVDKSPMKTLIQADYRNDLKARGVVESYFQHSFNGGAPGASFTGAATCKECHPGTYKFWSTTDHARAYKSLKGDPKPNVIYDAECVLCHTTGFEYTSGWRSEETTAHLAGNQCENCHGPGSKHAAEPDNAEFKKLMAVTAEQADKTRLCLKCHDQDNSPHFEFEEYWNKIEHNDKDQYNDPKVHVGIKPVVPAKAQAEPR